MTQRFLSVIFKACGVGITLISSCNMVLNTFSYSNADNKQMEDRIYRIGQRRNVNIYYQMFRNTRCEDVWNICLRKDLLFKNIIKKENRKIKKYGVFSSRV